MNLTHRKASIDDLKTIVSLISDDKLGQTREEFNNKLDQNYIDAFYKINSDPNQYLMVLCNNKKVIGTCHGTLMSSLMFKGSMRMQIEAVRIDLEARGENLGAKMIEFALEWGKKHGATIFQLTTNKKRAGAIKFYEKLGFKATHEGMKLYLEHE
jgi:GNAT superfamily N-acetyltransferase